MDTGDLPWEKAPASVARTRRAAWLKVRLGEGAETITRDPSVIVWLAADAPQDQEIFPGQKYYPLVADVQWRFFNSLFLHTRVDRNPIHFPGLAAIR